MHNNIDRLGATLWKPSENNVVLCTFLQQKQRALEYLNTLVSCRLDQLPVCLPLLKSTEETAATVLSRAGTSNASDNPANTSRLESRRRKRRNQENQNSTRNSQSTNRSSDLPLSPFTIEPNPFQMLEANIPIPITLTSNAITGTNSDHEFFRRASIININIPQNNDSISNSNIGYEFQSEMRTVIQALFEELQSTVPTTVNISSSERESGEIELYTVESQTPPS